MFKSIHRVVTSLLLLAAISISSVPAALAADHPENGFWWNKAEPGRGFNLEIQDNYLFFAVYIFDNQGAPLWYTTQGKLDANGNFTGVLTTARNGQCINCNFLQPQILLGAGGPIQINFTSNTAANLIWGNPQRTIPIERFDYFYTLDPADTQRNNVLRGEWNIVLDYTRVTSTNGTVLSSYYGDALMFTAVNQTTSPRTTTGCRSRNGDSTSCATGSRSAYGYLGSNNTHILAIDNDTSTNTVYAIKLDYTQFRGYAKVCPKSLTPVSCLNSTAPQLPVRGFRSKSFGAVSGVPGSPKSTSTNSNANSALPQAIGKVMTAEEVRANFEIDVNALHDPIIK